MASRAPNPIDVTDFQFKLHQKIQVFDSTAEGKSNINLLAAASNYGLIFIGDPSKPEIKVICLQNLVNTKENDEKLLVRTVPIPDVPHCIAVSSDNSLLAVSYTLDGSATLSFYSVTAFLSGSVPSKFIIRASPEENVKVLQILWNPVICNTLAVVLDNGAIGTFTLKESGFEFHSLDKKEQAQCACWSPKGKQIVVGFPGGRLVQYKPDLKPAKTILCPNNIQKGPFNTIAVQWLSTYQFAAVFLQEGEDMSPALFIINAPKTGDQLYTNYYDICYSQSGPRNAQIFFIHIQSWNILLMVTSNSMEAGILGTRETGETPTWVQYTTLDEARLELPLTSDKQDTFPIGFVLDTGCTHELTIGEKKIPTMPMVHVLSTHGLLISFNFLNLNENAPGICSPPQRITDISGLILFRPIDELLNKESISTSAKQEEMVQQIPNSDQTPDFSFRTPIGATSTPAPERKTKPVFGNQPNGNLFGNLGTSTGIGNPSLAFLNTASSAPTQTTFAAQNQQTTPLFGGGISGFGQISTQQQSSGVLGSITTSSPSINQGLSQNKIIPEKTKDFVDTKANSLGIQDQISKQNQQKRDPVDKSKPLYTVPPTYNPSTEIQKAIPKESTKDSDIEQSDVSNDAEIHEVIKELISTQIDSFELELREIKDRYKDVRISLGNIEDWKQYTKDLDELQKFYGNATEGSMEADIQALRYSLNESFAMLAEVKSKLELYKNSELSELQIMSPGYQTNRRQLAKLRSLITTNEAQLQIVRQQMDAQWASYQDLVRHNTQTKMYIPSLEGIYQTLTKQKDILSRQRIKINYIKSKLGVRSLFAQDNKNADIDVNSLADSILSMSLADQVKKEISPLSDDKLNCIRECLRDKKISKIKPQRPDRIGLSSEVILEAKVKQVQKRDGAITKPEKMEKERVKNQQKTITKPTPTKAVANVNIKPVRTDPKKTQNLFSGMQIVSTSEGTADKSTNQSSKEKIGELPSLPLTATTTISFVGNSFSKPIDTSKMRQPTTTSNIFSGSNPSATPIFVIPKSEPNKPTILTFGENKSQSIPNTKGIEKSKSTILPFGGGFGAVADNSKESLGVAFGSNESKQVFDFSGTAFSLTNKTSDIQQKQDVRDKDKSTSNTTVDQKASISHTQSFPSFGLNSTNTPVSGASNQALSGTNLNLNKPDESQGLTFGSLSLTVKSSEPSTVTTSVCTTVASTQIQSSSIVSSNFKFAITPKDVDIKTANTNAADTSNSTSPLAAPSVSDLGTSVAIKTSTSQGPTLGFSFGQTNLLSQPSTTSPVTPTSSADVADNLFGNLSICKPTALSSVPPTSKPGNIFAGSLYRSVPNTSTSESKTTTAPLSFATTSAVTTTASSTFSLISSPGLFQLPLSTSDSAPIAVPSSISQTTTAASVFGTSVATTAAPAFVIATTATTTTVFGTSTIATSTTSAFSPTSPVMSSVAKSSTGGASTLIFGSPNATTTVSIFGSPIATTTASIFSTPSATTVLSFGNVAATTSSLFGSAPAATSSIFTSPTTSIFGSTTPASSGSLYGASSTAAPTFGVTAPSSTTSIFGGATSITSSPFGSVPGTSSSAVFTQSAANAGTIFGGVPKPEQSVFSTVASTASNAPFGAPTTGTTLFGSPMANQPSSGGNIFESSSGTLAFGSQTSPNTKSIFGGGNIVSQSTSPFSSGLGTGSSIFGAPKSDANTDIFNSSNQANQVSSGNPLFGTSSFGAGGQTGLIFGGASGSSGTSAFNSFSFNQASTSPFTPNTQQQQQQQQQTPFGSSSTSGFGQNVFGGGSAFGSQSTAFGNTSPGGSFAQGGPSIAEKGFGSLNLNSGFQKPTFGGPPTFGSAPTFGGSPSFGGAPVFGSPKNTFGAFGGNTSGAFSPPTQESNIFEALGSSDNDISFGNLAQKANINTPKQQFGGSSFSNWRS